ncbi:hypothetical protein APY03_6273 [Variovorax sp. WDL1]|nr:hypothetical protein APY03_6273 [Variovorax sp. WDL1]
MVMGTMACVMPNTEFMLAMRIVLSVLLVIYVGLLAYIEIQSRRIAREIQELKGQAQ